MVTEISNIPSFHDSNIPDLIIFDCDGTLVDSEELNCKATVQLLEEYGITDYSVQRYMDEFAGMTLSDCLDAVARKTGKPVPEEIKPKYVEKVAELQKTELKPVAETIDILRVLQKHCKLCVGSNGERRNVFSSLSLSGYDEFFDESNIFTKIQVERAKPAPDLFFYAAEKMDVAPSKCLVIEDSVSGVAAGKAAGMTTWGFTGTAHDRAAQAQKLQKAGADDILDDIIHMVTRLTN